uniref:Uncharacterized protein n=1 Tax=Glossina pallidipes TaxID=7398 RepID=A0A1A9ZIA2_GLOPL
MNTSSSSYSFKISYEYIVVMASEYLTISNACVHDTPFHYEENEKQTKQFLLLTSTSTSTLRDYEFLNFLFCKTSLHVKVRENLEFEEQKTSSTQQLIIQLITRAKCGARNEILVLSSYSAQSRALQ